jgi:hypothetical protein
MRKGMRRVSRNWLGFRMHASALQERGSTESEAVDRVVDAPEFAERKRLAAR